MFFWGTLLLILNSALAQSPSEVLIKKGTYVPFFRDLNESDQELGPLVVDKYPVTNKDFLAFVKKNPSWKKSQVKALFANNRYLEHWKDDLSVSADIRDLPITNVSWFAARAYCRSKGKRLLKTSEWEYVSDAQNKQNLDLILNWYGKTGTKLKPVSEAVENIYGIVGMHGLIWEWVDDFGSAILSNDSRKSNESSKSLYCGSGSLKAKDPSQYATFMRFAHRSSLRADSVGRTLGFRCAKDLITDKGDL